MYLFWPEFSLAFQSALQFTHSPTFGCFFSHSLPSPCSIKSKDWLCSLAKSFIAITYEQSLLTLPLLTSPTLAQIWQSFLMKKVKGSREEGCGGHLAACTPTSTRLAGVINRWLASGGGVTGVAQKKKKKGELEMWDGRRGYDGSLLIKTHTWHTPT